MQLTAPLRLILAAAALSTGSGAWTLSSFMGYDNGAATNEASVSASATNGGGGLKGRRLDADDGTDMPMDMGTATMPPYEDEANEIGDDLYGDMDVSGLTAAQLMGEDTAEMTDGSMMTTMDEDDMNEEGNVNADGSADPNQQYVEEAPPEFDPENDPAINDEFATGVEHDVSPGEENADWIAEQEAAAMAEVDQMQQQEEEAGMFEEASEDEFDSAQAEAEQLAEDAKNAGTTLAESKIAITTDEIEKEAKSEAPLLTVSTTVTAEVAEALQAVNPDTAGDLPAEVKQVLLEETLETSESAEDQDAAEASAANDNNIPTPDDEPDLTVEEAEMGQANTEDVVDDSLPGHDAAENEGDEENTEDLGESVLVLGDDEILSVDEGIPDVVAKLAESGGAAGGEAPPVAGTADEVLEAVIEAADTEIYADEILEESAAGEDDDDGTPPSEVMQELMDEGGFYGIDLATSVEETIVDVANGEDELPIENMEPEGTEADDIPAEDLNGGKAAARRRA